MHVHDLAYVRAGDKGDVSNVAVMAKDAAAYELLERHLIPERIQDYFGAEVTGTIAVHPLPNILAFEVVMRGALGGGATTTLRFDGTGKSMCAVLSRMAIPA
jgi:hypothetical protein